jgi:hypothetical protein
MLPLLAYVISAAITFGSAPSLRSPEYPHVRSTDARIAALIQEATRRSPTFARLHASLQRTDVILFVEPSSQLKRGLSGQLVFLKATPLARYLRADIRFDLPRNALIEAIAHELQHALEIAESGDVRDVAGIDRLFRRIGTSARAHQYDTDRAYLVAARVRVEIA